MKEKNTAVRENIHQRGEQEHEESTILALEAICRSEPQSYEQFMNNFTELKPEDVVQSRVARDSAATKQMAQVMLVNLGSSTPVHDRSASNESQPTERQIHKGDVKEDNDNKSSVQSINNGIEEEVLEKGAVTQPYLARTANQTDLLKVKLDNFVEADDVEEEEGEWYKPSFAAASSYNNSGGLQVRGQLPPKDMCPEPKEELVVNEKASPPVAKAKVMTMLDELAASKAGKSVKKPKASSTGSAKVPTLLDELSTRKEGKCCPSDQATHNSSNDFDSALSQRLDMLLGSDDKPEDQNNSETNKLDLPEREHCEVAAQIMAHSSVAAKQANKTEENLLDLVGDDTLYDQEEGLTEELNEDESYNCMPYPGEVMEERDTLVKEFTTRLKFTAHVDQISSGPPPGNNSDTTLCSNEGNEAGDVQPFSLDADFDYDNVVLSPKFSEHEVTVIMNAVHSSNQVAGS